VRRQRALAGGVVVDQRQGVGLAEPDPGVGERRARGGEGAVQEGVGQAGELRHPTADVGAVGVEAAAVGDGVENPRGAGCQPKALLARSASHNVSQNHAAPFCHGSSRSWVRNDATSIRARLYIVPVRHSSRMPASIKG
jgi:hypothetical protein